MALTETQMLEGTVVLLAERREVYGQVTDKFDFLPWAQMTGSDTEAIYNIVPVEHAFGLQDALIEAPSRRSEILLTRRSPQPRTPDTATNGEYGVHFYPQI